MTDERRDIIGKQRRADIAEGLPARATERVSEARAAGYGLPHLMDLCELYVEEAELMEDALDYDDGELAVDTLKSLADAMSGHVETFEGLVVHDSDPVVLDDGDRRVSLSYVPDIFELGDRVVAEGITVFESERDGRMLAGNSVVTEPVGERTDADQLDGEYGDVSDEGACSSCGYIPTDDELDGSGYECPACGWDPLATDGGVQLPTVNDLVTVRYRSERSGNVVERSGTVDDVDPEPDADGLPWAFTVRVDSKGMAGGTYVVVEGRDDAPAEAFSVTTETDGMALEEHEDGSRTYTFSSKNSRVSHLGEYVGHDVDRHAEDPEVPVWCCRLTSSGILYVQAEDAEKAAWAAEKAARPEDLNPVEVDLSAVTREDRQDGHRLVDDEGNQIKEKWN